MDHQSPLILALLCATSLISCLLTSSDASHPAEQYWHSILPNTPLPGYLRRQIQLGIKSQTQYTYRPNANVGYLFNYKYIKEVTAQPEKNHVSNMTVFFLHKDMNPQAKMWPHFYKSILDPGFLPRRVVDPIPFSTHDFPKILSHFLVKPESTEAAMIKETLAECEAPTLKGEVKHCATSLESMIDFNAKSLGKNIEVTPTNFEEDYKKQEYTIATNPKLIGGNAVISHKMTYPHAVFYSHWINDTRVYMLPLVGADGTKIKSVAVCHMDTSEWYEGHLAFQVLKVKPGVPICHFSGNDALIWVSKEQLLITT